MTQINPKDIRSLSEEANASKHKETYKLMEKNSAYRIGVGARAPSSDNPSFFIEVLVNLSTKAAEVNLAHLEKLLACLKNLEKRGYTLTFEDVNCVSCEKRCVQDLSGEFLVLKSLLKPLSS